MAGRALRLNPFSLLVRDAGWAGVVAFMLLIALVGGTLLVLLTASPAAVLSTQLGDPYLYRVVGFTVWQASLSTLLSVLLAVPTARAFARLSGAGRFTATDGVADSDTSDCGSARHRCRLR